MLFNKISHSALNLALLAVKREKSSFSSICYFFFCKWNRCILMAFKTLFVLFFFLAFMGAKVVENKEKDGKGVFLIGSAILAKIRKCASSLFFFSRPGYAPVIFYQSTWCIRNSMLSYYKFPSSISHPLILSWCEAATGWAASDLGWSCIQTTPSRLRRRCAAFCPS